MINSSRRKADMMVAAAKERKAFDLTLLKVGEHTSIADYFFICSGRSNRQVQALAEHIRDRVKKDSGQSPLGMEGVSQGHWVLIDYGDVIAHIFYDPIREFYDLEGLWLEAERIDVGPENRENQPTHED